MPKQTIDTLLNQIPTKLRGKFISAINNNKFPKQQLLTDLQLLAEQTSQKILPKIAYPDLPVAEKVDDIKKLIQDNQVIFVAGETGSGKSTQLPKICVYAFIVKKTLIIVKSNMEPEILRTNLASAILQMLFLKLGSIQDFPFIDVHDTRFVKDSCFTLV